MSSTVSYANIAAKGTKEAGEKEVLLDDGKGVEQVRTTQREVSSGSSVADEVTAASGENGSEKIETDEEPSKVEAAQASAAAGKKEKERKEKALAPAPVPEKSAWGAAVVQPEQTNSISVDEHKWPTPDRVIQMENDHVNRNNQQKFIKPFTAKWVPINAKVVLPSNRTGSQKQKNRKNKKQTQQANQKRQSAPNGPVPVGTTNIAAPVKTGQHEESDVQRSASEEKGEIQSPHGLPEEQFMHDQKGELDTYQAQKYHIDGMAPQFVPGVTFNPDGTQQFQGQYGQQGYVDGFRQRFNQNNPNYQQKNFRRFNNGNGSPTGLNGGPNTGNQQNYKQRFNNVNPQAPPRNGFYHPQPFVQNQNYQNFNNRQFRPQNGQVRPIQNKSLRPQNGFRNSQVGFPPQQVQIPPPISPQQDPKQALIQQIDYYFSLENLIRDIFLRKNMDAKGWVSLDLILNFKRVKIIINGIQNSSDSPEVDADALILDCIKKCANLEIDYKNDKSADDASIGDINLRVKEGHQQWLLPTESAN